MKRFFLIIVFSFCVFYLCIAQLCYDPDYTYITTVKTPKGNTVPETYIFTGTDFSTPNQGQIDAWKADLYEEYGANAVYVGAPSKKYNCHGYAWHVYDGGSYVWIDLCIGTTGHYKYWTDNSYVSVNETSASRVSYTGNHSAIRFSSSSYQSKWGNFLLVNHYPNSVPAGYQPTSPKGYYCAPLTSLTLSYNTNLGPGSQVTIQASVSPSNLHVSYVWNPSQYVVLPTPPAKVLVTCTATNGCSSIVSSIYCTGNPGGPVQSP